MVNIRAIVEDLPKLPKVPKAPEVPVLKPGATVDVPLMSKYGQLQHDTDNINSELYYLNATHPKYSELAAAKKSLESRMKSDRIIAYINKHCSDYVREIKAAGELLYRGIKIDESQNRFSFIGNSRTNRKPLDSNELAAKEFDQMLAELGFEALRKNSIFVTSKWEKAGGFGTKYIIFPFNSAKYTYTSKADLILSTTTIKEWSKYAIDNKGLEDKLANKLGEIYDDAVEYRIKLIGRSHLLAPNKRSEIYIELHNYDDLIHGLENSLDITLGEVQGITDYHALIRTYEMFKMNPRLTAEDFKLFYEFVKFVDPYIKKIRKTLDLETFKKMFKPQNTKLSGAIKNGKEIYISGHYLALRATEFKTIIRKKILGQ